MSKAGPPGAPREVSPALLHALVRYLERAAGAGVVDRVLAESPVPLTRADLQDRDRWFASAEVVAFAHTAARICNDAEIGRRAGAEYYAIGAAKGLDALLVSAGSIAAAVRASAARGERMSTGRRYVVREAAESHLVLDGVYTDVASADPYYCGFTAGFYAQVPTAFGMRGDVVETECQLRGGERCAYRLSWHPDPSAVEVSDEAVARGAARVEELFAQLEDVRSMTSDLLRAEHVDEALAKITQMAGRAVQAPRYLLAVQVDGDSRRRVHHQGFRSSEVDRFADRLLAGDVDESSGVLIADVVSADHRYGRLAACYPRGCQFSDLDRRLLTAYAAHAAVVLQQVTALERARRDRDTAEALLGLARTLGGVQTIDEIARRIVAAVPRVADADTAALWVWSDTGELRLAAFTDPRGRIPFPGPPLLTAQQLPGLSTLPQQRRPLLIEREAASAGLLPMLEGSGLAAVACVPIVAHETFVGLVCAGYRQPVTECEALFARLAGLADHAAIAVQSAHLVERMSHRAWHDALTGLANRDLLEQRAARDIEAAREQGHQVGLVFVDLDRFKDVNDTFGHAAGDELLTVVADRLAATTRSGDTLGRLGGDEFLLVLPGITGAEEAVAAAQRMQRCLADPVSLADGAQVSVSSSAGIALFPAHGDDYETLLRRADTAMYAAKRAGRAGVAVFAADASAGRRTGSRLAG